MNLVDLIKDQLSPEITNKLGALAGSGEVQTKSAVAATVPALLAALAGLASKGESGAETLASTLSRFSSGSLGSVASEISNRPDQALEQGGNLLRSLFGESTLSGLISAISKFAKLDLGAAKSLISGIAPLVMGTIANQFQGKSVTGQGLANLFSEQKWNIANAIPAGLSLAGIPGLPQIGDAARNVADTAQRTAQTAAAGSSSLLKTLLPLVVLAAAAIWAWSYFSGRNETAQTASTNANPPLQHEVRMPVSPSSLPTPDVTQFSKDLTSVYSNATEELAKVKDAESAKAALPKLEQMRTKLDSLKAIWEKLPAAARASIARITTDHLGKFRELSDRLMGMPGVKDVLQPILNQIVPMLESFKS